MKLEKSGMVCEDRVDGDDEDDDSDIVVDKDLAISNLDFILPPLIFIFFIAEDSDDEEEDDLISRR